MSASGSFPRHPDFAIKIDDEYFPVSKVGRQVTLYGATDLNIQKTVFINSRLPVASQCNIYRREEDSGYLSGYVWKIMPAMRLYNVTPRYVGELLAKNCYFDDTCRELSSILCPLGNKNFACKTIVSVKIPKS